VTTPNPPQSGPQQPYPGGPGQPGPQQEYPGQQGYPGGPVQPPAQPKKRRLGLRIGLTLGVVVVVLIIGFVSKFLTGDPDTAKVGDCMSGSSAENLKVVKCADAKAEFKVVGKVDGKSQTDFNVSSTQICKPFPNAESAFWKGERGGKGYVLCLGSNK